MKLASRLSSEALVPIMVLIVVSFGLEGGSPQAAKSVARSPGLHRWPDAGRWPLPALPEIPMGSSIQPEARKHFNASARSAISSISFGSFGMLCRSMRFRSRVISKSPKSLSTYRRSFRSEAMSIAGASPSRLMRSHFSTHPSPETPNARISFFRSGTRIMLNSPLFRTILRPCMRSARPVSKSSLSVANSNRHTGQLLALRSHSRIQLVQNKWPQSMRVALAPIR
mmetsp:Transcript_56126/g.182118  ORF Transcript_56126/g.182118 Transcript_56126/m.182118 type:complete len:226 (-) Transcript_56126:512-1189(-)